MTFRYGQSTANGKERHFGDGYKKVRASLCSLPLTLSLAQYSEGTQLPCGELPCAEVHVARM